MTADEAKKKYTRVTRMGDTWCLYLEIDHQGFRIDSGETKREAQWMQKMLAIALARMIDNNANV
jgi:hypothetical protein